MTTKPLVGPVLSDLESIGGGTVTLATAFYSAGALNALDFEVDKLRVLVRLDVSSVFDWAARAIDPPALRNFLERQTKNCGSVKLLISPTAHAKVYRGQDGYLIGSANLSARAFSGRGDEILWFESDSERQKLMDVTLATYERGFKALHLIELKNYISKNEEKARVLAKQFPRNKILNEDRIPKNIIRASRLGSYADFLSWLNVNNGAAATVIYNRANGEGNLNGHIRQNFFGLRQFFLFHPSETKRFSKENPETYKLAKDEKTLLMLSSFVKNQTWVEDSFSIDTWRSYLPEKAGGKPKTGGGTSGNLNRMMPLVARYILAKIKG